MKRFIAVVVVAMLSLAVNAGPKTITPPVGSVLRNAILSPARSDASGLLGVSVRWKVRKLRVGNNYAFFSGDALDTKERPMDFAKTKLKREFLESKETGVWEGGFAYLLAKRGKVWTILEREVAGSRGDTQIGEWMRKYPAAKGLISD